MGAERCCSSGCPQQPQPRLEEALGRTAGDVCLSGHVDCRQVCPPRRDIKFTSTQISIKSDFIPKQKHLCMKRVCMCVCVFMCVYVHHWVCVCVCRFQEQREFGSCCYGFALGFINHMRRSEGNQPISSEHFTAQYVLPRLSSASTYLSIYQHVCLHGFYSSAAEWPAGGAVSASVNKAFKRTKASVVFCGDDDVIHHEEQEENMETPHREAQV